MLFVLVLTRGSGGGDEALPALRGSHKGWHSWGSAWEVSPVWRGDWTHLGLVRCGGRAGLEESMWELGVLRSRWRRQTSGFLLIGTGDTCPFWWG